MDWHTSPEFSAQGDESVDEIATDWYFLNVYYREADPVAAQLVVEPLIECERRLKQVLSYIEHDEQHPLKIFADQEMFFYVWLDAWGELQAGELDI